MAYVAPVPTYHSSPYRHFLREWRLKRGLTQDELGRAIGVTKAMISRYELNQRAMTLDIQFALMGALRITPTQFFSSPNDESMDVVLQATSPEQRAAAIRMIKAMIEG